MFYVCHRSHNGDRYFNESRIHTQIKCFAAAVPGAILQTIALIVGTVYRIFHVLSFHHLWQDNPNMTLKYRFIAWIVDCIRIVISPLGIPCLVATGVYGVFKPRDGRKLHARMEIIFHGGHFLVPCFHPQLLQLNLNYPISQLQHMTCRTLVQTPLLLIFYALRVICFFSFFEHAIFKTHNNLSMRDKTINWLKDVSMIFGVPIAFVMSILTILWSGIQPIQGLEYFNKIQIFLFEPPKLSNPVGRNTGLDPSSHLFGGDVKTRDTW